MLEQLGEANTAALIGLGGGVVLGLAARIGRFCTLGAIEDYLYGADDRRLRMWALAIGVAIIGCHLAMSSDLLDGASTAYLDRVWNPAGSIVGGLMFGYGMALSGNCGYGAIARLGGGDLRSFVIVLVMGISTYVVLSGPLAPLRNLLFEQQDVTSDLPPGLAHHLSALTHLPLAGIGISAGFVLIGISLWDQEFRRDHKSLFWSVVVGLAVVSGWAGTAYINARGFEALPVVSHSFSAPLGETILWTMTGSLRPLSFAVGSISGVWLGAFLGSLIKGHFRWEACDDPRELRRQIIGAAIMGIGAVLAMGCTIGQGLSAFSLLSLSAPVTFLSIFAGAALGLRQLITGFRRAA